MRSNTKDFRLLVSKNSKIYSPKYYCSLIAQSKYDNTLSVEKIPVVLRLLIKLPVKSMASTSNVQSETCEPGQSA